jgi:tRNA pseudouridine55 synthase
MTVGFLTIDKPGGVSSSHVVSEVRKATGIKKVGHAGTLDPMATGAVVTAIGPVTRLIRYVQDQEKEYVATALFGVATDTLDADGAVLTREPMSFRPEEVVDVAGRFVGTICQVPPMVSALKHEGRRLYELAREGVVIERNARPVEIYELEILGVGAPPYPEVTFRVVCGKGTYVRSLADDLASALGGRAHLTALRRTRIGTLTLEKDGLRLDEVADWARKLVSPADALQRLPSVVVGVETARGVIHGVRFLASELAGAPEGISTRVLDQEGRLLAVYRRDGDHARPEVVVPQ